HVYRYTIAGATDAVAVKASEVDIGSTGSTGGQVRRGPDGRMYIAADGATSISVVNAPDAADPLDVDFVSGGFALAAGTSSRFGLPQTVTGCPATSADVVITKALVAESGTRPGAAEAGELLTWEITLTNTGGTDATGYAVTDSLDPNVTFDSADNGGALIGGNVEWSGLTVPLGGSLVLTVTTTVNSPIPAGVTAIGNAAYEAGGTPPDCSVTPRPANCASIPVTSPPLQVCTDEQVRASQRWWYFGASAGIDFGTGGTTATPTVGTATTSEGTTVVTDTAGDLLFWSNGDRIYNRNQAVMLNGTGLLGSATATQTVAAFPSVTQQGIYFVVTTNGAGGNSGELHYSIVDMALDGGLGGVTATKNVQLGLSNTSSEGLTAVPNADGTGFWVLTFTYQSPNALAYLFDGAGPADPDGAGPLLAGDAVVSVMP